MRDVKTAILPPRGTLLLQPSSPILPTEKPFLMTLNKQGISMKVINPSMVLLTNQTEFVAPIFFSITREDFSIASLDWLATNIQRMLQGAKPK